MTQKSGKLNGSVDLFANAMCQIISDAVEGAVKPVHEELSSIKGNMATKSDIEDTNKKIDTTNTNMQSQFAEQEKKIGKFISNLNKV